MLPWRFGACLGRALTLMDTEKLAEVARRTAERNGQIASLDKRTYRWVYILRLIRFTSALTSASIVFSLIHDTSSVPTLSGRPGDFIWLEGLAGSQGPSGPDHPCNMSVS